MTDVEQLFDKLLQLQEGDKILVPFATESEMLSKRAMLFKQKREYYNKMAGLGFKAIFISQRVNKHKDTYQLILSTSGTDLDWIGNAVIMKKDGSKEGLGINQNDAERIMKLKNEIKGE